MGSKYLESFISDFQIFSDGNRADIETICGRDMALSEYQGFEAFQGLSYDHGNAPRGLAWAEHLVPTCLVLVSERFSRDYLWPQAGYFKGQMMMNHDEPMDLAMMNQWI